MLTFHKIRINVEPVKNYLTGLNRFTSLGVDELHPRILKELTDVLSELPLIIFEKSWKMVSHDRIYIVQPSEREKPGKFVSLGNVVQPIAKKY